MVIEHSDAVGNSEIVNKNNESIVSVEADRINLGTKESWHWMKGTNNYHMRGYQTILFGIKFCEPIQK